MRICWLTLCFCFLQQQQQQWGGQQKQTPEMFFRPDIRHKQPLCGFMLDVSGHLTTITNSHCTVHRFSKAGFLTVVGSTCGSEHFL